MYAVDIRPLWFVGAAKDDAIVVLGLNTEDAAGRQDRVVDMCQAAVGAGEDEILQYVWRPGVQNLVYAPFADLLRNDPGDMRGGCSEQQCQEQCCGDRDDEQADARVREARDDFSVGCPIRCDRRQNDQSACRGKRIREKSRDHR